MFDAGGEVLDEGVAAEGFGAVRYEQDVIVHQGKDGIEVAVGGRAGPGGDEVADLLGVGSGGLGRRIDHRGKSIPQGLKPLSSTETVRPDLEGSGYLFVVGARQKAKAKAKADPLRG
jgi:hypothetical protein